MKYAQKSKSDVVSLLHLNHDANLQQVILKKEDNKKLKLILDSFSPYEASKNKGIFYLENTKGYPWGFIDKQV